jgi:transcription elongation factor GreA
MQKIYLTQDGYDKLNIELDDLKRRRREVAGKIEEARQEGDISENAEYHAQRELQGQIQAKIDLLEDKLGRAEIIKEGSIDLSRVRIGVKVKLMDIDMDEEVFYTIKSDEEADFDNDEIGINSPLAQAMLGKGKGETFDFQAPRGTYQFKILAISLP